MLLGHQPCQNPGFEPTKRSSVNTANYLLRRRLTRSSKMPPPPDFPSGFEISTASGAAGGRAGATHERALSYARVSIPTACQGFDGTRQAHYLSGDRHTADVRKEEMRRREPPSRSRTSSSSPGGLFSTDRGGLLHSSYSSRFSRAHRESCFSRAPGLRP